MAGEQLISATDGRRLIDATTGQPLVYVAGTCTCCGSAACGGPCPEWDTVSVTIAGVIRCTTCCNPPSTASYKVSTPFNGTWELPKTSACHWESVVTAITVSYYDFNCINLLSSEVLALTAVLNANSSGLFFRIIDSHGTERFKGSTPMPATCPESFVIGNILDDCTLCYGAGGNYGRGSATIVPA